MTRTRGGVTTAAVDPARPDSYAHQLSGGMRQRVMIAMALALNPQVMIMDEPTTALDVVVQREILREIMRLREQFGFAVVFITHDLPLLLEISDRIAVMLDGEIVELGTAENIYERPQHAYTQRLLESFPSLVGERGGFVRSGAAAGASGSGHAPGPGVGAGPGATPAGSADSSADTTIEGTA